jgi:GNAT superfamily N-acetyltransferase
MDARSYRFEDKLRNGTMATIRAIRPDDKQRLIDAFEKLHPETIYRRWFSHKKELTEDELRRITEVDFDGEVILVITTGAPGDETVIAAARYVRGADADGAEISFVVEEDYQGQGLASRLLEHLARIARTRGIARFHAHVLAENRPMLAVFARSGLPMEQQRQSGEVNVTLALDASGGQ